MTQLPWTLYRLVWTYRLVARSSLARFLLLLLLARLLAAGCRGSERDVANGPDPIAALHSRAVSTRYGVQFWKEVSVRDTTLWARAVTLCTGRDAAQLPNCAAVSTALFYQRNTRPALRGEPFSLRPDANSHLPDTPRAPRDSPPPR